MLKKSHLINGKWIDGSSTFTSDPAHGPAYEFAVGTTDLVDSAVTAAEEAFWSYGYSSRADRAAFLERIADEIDARGSDITEIGTQETGLPAARLEGERGRTVGQLRLFARYIVNGSHLDIRHDKALPDRQPLPRSDLRLVQRPIGPVAVFGASNFPLAFSTAGGDTASALAAGCPVVVKSHSAHPGTSDVVAQAIAAAAKSLDLHPGVFSLIQGGNREVGTSLVQHPQINAVGFTGSLAGGRALFDLCAARPQPIPFFGELGSINPMFVLPGAIAKRGTEIGNGWSGSLTLGAGQFCTNPGIAVVLEGADADAFTKSVTTALKDVAAQIMLTDGIADAYRSGVSRTSTDTSVRKLIGTSCSTREASPYLYTCSGDAWLANDTLGEEVFGPHGLIVHARDIAQMREIALRLQGQLTCTLHIDESDTEDAKALLPVLERKAGRILVNGFPTGVEVCDAMVHGGPYPASTNFGATSVGTMAIRRFLRPVCYQDVPSNLLPVDLLS
jgi:alpha-ketoglutaric semialdehyde dehydrogenase